MKELLLKIKKEAERTKQSHNSLFKQIKAFEKSLKETVGDLQVYADSKTITLEPIGLEDRYYGYLSFSNGKLSVCYRSTEEDTEESFQNDLYPQGFTVANLDNCNREWLFKLSKESITSSLLENLYKNVHDINKNLQESLDGFEELLDKETKIVLDDLDSELSNLGIPDLQESLQKAREYILTKPDESVTHSSSYIETVCRFIIKEQGQEIPPRKDMSALISNCMKCLDLSPDQIALQDVKQITGGLQSIAKGIGALRTHFSSAHGKTPGDYEINSTYAKLCCNAAAALTSYLIEKHKEKRKNLGVKTKVPPSS